MVSPALSSPSAYRSQSPFRMPRTPQSDRSLDQMEDGDGAVLDIAPTDGRQSVGQYAAQHWSPTAERFDDAGAEAQSPRTAGTQLPKVDRHGSPVPIATSADMSVSTEHPALPSPPLTRPGSKAGRRSSSSQHLPLPHSESAGAHVQEVLGVDMEPAETAFALDAETTPRASGSPALGEASTSRRQLEDEHEHVLEHPLAVAMARQKGTPPPWELIDPPEENGNGLSGHVPMGTYSTAATRVIDGQSSRRRLIPKSSYYFGPPPAGSAYGSEPIGHIGVHYPREVVRIERDYSGGELIQFSTVYPLEFEGRITPTQFLETMNAMNEILISAHSLRWTFLDNVVQLFSLQISRLFLATHYDKEMRRLHQLVDHFNTELYNPVGLNILWPRKVAFMFLEVEYY